ncbi:RNA polymerase sigma factor [Marinifilum fragile]|uniref:RNA polymerase sigma factor n=1 Tax=Marinifilum fragile TaxID=570161 RepID=UPI0009F90F53|nr:RNA polymerase sigma factor [Marinifilum fragile]
MKNRDDEQLMILVRSGELNALSPLFDKYHIRLYNFFLRLTKNQSISEDLVQSVFRRILTYRKTYNEQHKFRSWMYQIARNVHANYYRDNKLVISDFSEPEKIEYETDSAIEEMEKESRKRILYEAMDGLQTDQKEIIELSRFQGLKYREIAEITGLSETAVKVKAHRAINKLRELYFKLA